MSNEKKIRNELVFLPDGWNKAFGDEMVNELIDILKNEGILEQYIVLQVKEKWGVLDWYDCIDADIQPTEDFYINHEKWKNKYRELSRNTCICCGEPTLRTICPICEKKWEEKRYEK